MKLIQESFKYLIDIDIELFYLLLHHIIIPTNLIMYPDSCGTLLIGQIFLTKYYLTLKSQAMLYYNNY